MKKFFVIGVVAAAALVSGCETKRDAQGNVVVSDAQRIAVQICSFMPLAETVLNILNTGSPALDTGTEIAQAVCNAVNTPRSAGQPPMVAGVVVKGSKVQK